MANRRKLKKVITVIVVLVVVGFIISRFMHGETNKPIIRTAKVEYGTVVSSVSGNGVLQPYTTVEVKSNVGGSVVQLAVDEGDYVKAGQLIARIDPADSLSNLQQVQADLYGAQAKVTQSVEAQRMQSLQTAANIQSAQHALETARQRYLQAQNQAQAQPRLTETSINEASSNLASAEASLQQTKSALIPQKQSSAESAYNQAKANLVQAQKNLTRQKALLKDGFVPSSAVDSAQQQYDVAQAQLETAKSSWDTIKEETDQDLRAAQARVQQAKASLENAKANRIQVTLKKQDVAAARAAVKQAEAALALAKSNSYQNSIKAQDITQAKAQMARTQATYKNAQTQLGYTTIVAPSNGVVVKKYVEAGSIVTAGRSSFSGTGSGVGLVDIANIDHMQVLVNVDETDIAQIKVGQPVDVSVDAYENERFRGVVSKVAPQAVVDQNVTTIPVTVDIINSDRRLKPAMNATCDFITGRKQHVLLVPNEAVNEGKRGSTVTVMEGDKQVIRRVQVGVVGNDATEIIRGLKEGENVVTAVIQPVQMPSGGQAGAGNGGGGQGGSQRGGRGPRGMRPF